MENPKEIRASSFPLSIKLGMKRTDRYSLDDFHPSTPPGDVEFTNPPLVKPQRRRSKYRDLLGEHLEIPEKNELIDQSSFADDGNVSLNIVPSKNHSYRLPERDKSGQKREKISAEVIKHQFTAQTHEMMEAQHRNFEETPSSDAMLQMLEKASISSKKPLQKSSSHSDLLALKKQNSKKDDTDSIPHVHTEECRLNQMTVSNVNGNTKRSSSTTDLVTTRRAELRQMNSQMYAQIKTRFTASAEAVRSMQEKNRVESPSHMTNSPVAQPELHKQSIFGKFVNWGTGKTIEIGNRDANILGPTSF